MFCSLILKLTLAIVAVAMLTVAAAAGTQSKLIIKDFVGTINWTQSSDDINVDVVQGTNKLEVIKKGNNQVQILGEHSKLERIKCKGPDEEKRISVTRKRAYKFLDDYPDIKLSVPENTVVILQNSIPFIYGNPSVDVFEAALRGCGHVEVGNVRSRFTVNITGSTEFIVGNVGDLHAQLAGASEFQGGNIQSLNAELSGASELHLGDIAGTVDLKLVGATESSLGNVGSDFSYFGSGASDIEVNSTSGNVSIIVRGLSDVYIKDGLVPDMKVTAKGSSKVRFDGEVVSLAAKAGNLADINIKRDKDISLVEKYNCEHLILGKEYNCDD